MRRIDPAQSHATSCAQAVQVCSPTGGVTIEHGYARGGRRGFGNARTGAFGRFVRRIALAIGIPASVAGGGFAFVHVEAHVSARDWDPIVAEVIAGPLPSLVRGQAGFARAGDLSIWYESLEPTSLEPRGTILLMIGIADDAFGWPPPFIDALLERGYRVVRYDHRGTGLSDWEIGESRFTLADMAGDAVAVLDEIGVDQAHLVGISMGGMVAQQLAISHPDRAASLTSINSTGDIFDPELPGVSRMVQARLAFEQVKHLMRGGERSLVLLRLAERHILMGSERYALDVRSLAEAVLYNTRHRRGLNYRAMLDHMRAIGRSGSRHAALAALDLPVLVVHGVDDPLLPVAHGKKTARSISGARSLFLDGMGHDIADPLADRIADAIVAMIEE